MSTYREGCIKAKESRRTKINEFPNPGNQLKKQPSRKKLPFVLMCDPGKKGGRKPYEWNRYRTGMIGMQALNKVGKTYAFYRFTLVGPDDEVIGTNEEAYQERLKRLSDAHKARS